MKRILALVLGFAMLLSLTACRGSSVESEAIEVPSNREVRKAVEKEYDMSFVLDDCDIAKDESRAEWVFISEDGTLEVTVTWKARKPDDFKFDERVLASPTTTTEEPTTTTTYDPYDDPYYDEGNYYEYGWGTEYINLWSYSDEGPGMIMRYIDMNPEFGDKYTVGCTVIQTYDGAYQQSLDAALVAGGTSAPDMYFVEADFAVKYTQGDMSPYAAAYEDLGIDVGSRIDAADLAQFTVDIGSRDGEVVALSYQAYSGAMVYRASIAEEVFGTSDPDDIEYIFGAGSGSWDDFLDAADTLHYYGYSVISGPEDLFYACVNSSSEPWLDSDYTVQIAPEREAYFDVAKTLVDEGYTNGSSNWTEQWYSDMGDSNVFCFFGPSWYINYILIGNSGGYEYGDGSYGDWRVCVPPVGFYWGGAWVLANKDTDMPEGVAELIEWMTLDTSETGLQYLYANDFVGYGVYDVVPSGVVMEKSYGGMDFLGGQDMFPVFIECNELVKGKGVTQYDESINMYFKYASMQYANGEMTRDDAIKEFIEDVYDGFGF